MGRLGTDKQSRYSHEDTAARYRRGNYTTRPAQTGSFPPASQLDSTDELAHAQEVSRAQESRSKRDIRNLHNANRAYQAQGAYQRPDYSPSASNYRSRYAHDEPSDVSLLVRAGIVVVLLIALIGTFAARGGTYSTLNFVNTQLSEAHLQLDELTAANEELQAQIEQHEAAVAEYSGEE